MAKSSKGKKTGKNVQKPTKADEKTALKTAASGVNAPSGTAPSAAPVQGAPPVKQEAVVVEEPVVVMESPVLRFIKAHFSIYTIGILAVMAIMLYIRTVPSWNNVFTNWTWINGTNYVNVDMSDSVYTMHLVYNTIAHFPVRILYDPFTNVPFGSNIHFGPLYTIAVAFTAIVVGLGHPSTQLIADVGAIFPAVIGALYAIPTYYLGKKLFGRNAAFIAALVMAFLPGQFLFRSMLGFTDHHVFEVLFTVATIAFLVYALDAAKKSNLSFEQIRKRDYKALRDPLLYSFLAGAALGCYVLSWPAALLVAFMLFAYFVIQCMIDHVQGKSLEYIPIVGTLLFIVPAIMVLPYSLTWLSFQIFFYSITQPFFLCVAAAGLWFIYGMSRLLRQNKVDKWAYPVTIIGVTIIGLLVIYVALPWLYNLLMDGLMEFVNISNSGTSIAETMPTYIDSATGQVSFAAFWQFYDWTFPIFIVGMFLLAYQVVRKWRPAELMFLIWNVFMFVATLVEIRFNYYFAVNTALLTGYFALVIYNWLVGPKFKASFDKSVKSLNDLPKFLQKNQTKTLTAALIAIIFLVVAIWPATSLGQDLTWQGASQTLGMPFDWFDALNWMNTHTPDPQGSPVQANFSYANGTYQRPTNASGEYSYPPSAYGVMSWWDYGHDIEYVAQRAPNANPFQDGVVEDNGTLGAAPFFVSTNETASVNILNALDSRYIVIDNQMATGKFPAIEGWVGDTSGWFTNAQEPYIYSDGVNMYQSSSTVPTIVDSAKWNSSIMNRLYYDDCDGMSHYRLVYESNGSYYINSYLVSQSQNLVAPNNPIAFGNYTVASQMYQSLDGTAFATDSSGTEYICDVRPPVKYVKVFEKVDGATITGSAPDGTNVTASLNVTTDYGRTFTYTQTATAVNGTYSMIVPYPSEKMQGPGYTYGFTMDPAYNVTVGNTTQTVFVPETAVMNGGTVQVT